MRADRPDPDDLLCEHCGYVLNGLRRRDACPECGRPIMDSHPDARVGSPWQRGVRMGVLHNTVAFIRSPWRMFGQVRVDEPSARRLEAESIAWAGTLLALLAGSRALLAMRDAGPGIGMIVLVAVIVPVIGFVLFVFLLLGLTATERIGIRVFGKFHHRRITRAVAETVVAHAATGWIVSALLTWAGWLLGSGTAWLGRREPWAMWELTLTAPYWMPVAGFIIGLLWFETLVYVGVRRMRFANAPSAAARLEDALPDGDVVATDPQAEQVTG
ncbi:MAG: zinc ribbon domain-containing protein [Leptolyngbya sp. PLA3]|nr:MAG: zinc ribbon domain-containing protein [Cyanobacteria bacterium CYA]MCE7968766.1 zinc ribbon domain-containing protein [Leptolyngbya sp. PL-A3]